MSGVVARHAARAYIAPTLSEVQPTDLLTLLLAAAFLYVVVIVASLLRAPSVDPVAALRET